RAAGRLALALQLAAGLALFHYFLSSQWVPLSPDLFNGPFPSTLMLCASLFYTIGLFRRAAAARRAR
ncbi:MAG: hypothetical protein H7Z39_03960, partial [Burkholderiaceae bacterium]|nr:hypothetical protein [Burkholderiaceae bacterium]